LAVVIALFCFQIEENDPMKCTRYLPACALGAALAAVALSTAATGQQPAGGQQPSPGAGPYTFTPTWDGTILQSGPARLQSQAHQLAQQYVKAEKEDEKKDIRKKLVQALDQQFDQHSQDQQKELDELEKQVSKLRALLKKRKDAKENIVERRMEQLIQEADGLGWNAPGGRTANPFGANTTVFGGAGFGGGSSGVSKAADDRKK
jgi:flagellar motility protein MotE (MotC chaperone)